MDIICNDNLRFFFTGHPSLRTLNGDRVISSKGYSVPIKRQIELLGLKPGDICYCDCGCVCFHTYKVRIISNEDYELSLYDQWINKIKRSNFYKGMCLEYLV